MVNVVVGNQILDGLPPLESSAIAPHLCALSLAARDVLYSPNKPLDQVYFPTGSVLSVLAVMRDGSSVEIGTVGREGVTGAQLILGNARAPSEMICQVSGPALRISAADFMAHFETAPTFRRRVYRYTEALFNFMGQSIACNGLHSVNERCARWLLSTRDRVGRDEFHLTQECLAMMLGVRRPGVTIAAGALQQAGFISYRRGHVEIRDPAGLESAACECYQVTADWFAADAGDAAVGS